MVHGKLTLEEINQRQASLMQRHRDRVLASGSSLPKHIIDIQWIRNYAKRYREDMVKLGLVNACK